MFVHNFYINPHFLILFSLILLYFFKFWEEKDIKESKNIYLASYLMEVGNETLIE